MMNKLLATAAIVALATAAQAQDATAPAPMAPDASTSTMAPAGTGSVPMFLPSASADMHLATNLIGEPVYNGTSEDSQSIGEVNDLVLASDGSIDAVVIGVGGFLGVGEKNVAVDFQNLSWTVAADQTDRLILATTSDDLQNAPAFDVSAIDADPNAASSTSVAVAPAAPAMAPDATVTAPAPADQMAAVPQRDTLTGVDLTTVSANDLINTAVYAGDDENVGEVGDVLLNQDGTIDAVVLDVGGFLGIGQKPVAIDFGALDIRRDENGTLYVYTTFTREQLESAPNYDAETFPTDRDTMILRNVG